MQQVFKFTLENTDMYLKYINPSNGLYISKNLTSVECHEFANNSVELKNILQTELNLENFQDLLMHKLWINYYPKNSFNEIHNHTGNDWQQECNYIGILILNTGIDEEIIIYDETNSHPNFYKLNKGDCFVINNNIFHGLSTVKDSVAAVMFPIKICQ
jgi:hypothetical protein